MTCMTLDDTINPGVEVDRLCIRQMNVDMFLQIIVQIAFHFQWYCFVQILTVIFTASASILYTIAEDVVK